MKILFKRKSNTFSIEPNKLTNYLQIEIFDKQHIFPLDDIFVSTLFSFWADVVFKNIRRIWLIAKPLPGKYSTTEILPVWSSAVGYVGYVSRVWSILLATLTDHTERRIQHLSKTLHQ